MSAVLGALETVAYRHRSHAVPWKCSYGQVHMMSVMMTMMIIDQGELGALETISYDDDEVDVTPTELVGGEL